MALGSGRCRLAFVVSVAGTSLSSTTGSFASDGSAQAATPPQATAPQAGYVGTDTCVTCHTDQEASIKASKHGQAKNPRTPAAAHGCESCHGPGQAHVDDDAKGHILKFGAMKPADVSQTCLACHNRGTHAGWEGSAHDRAQSLLHDLPQRPQPASRRRASW